jgi:subtilase family serine protease
MAAGQQAATVPARITQPVDMEKLVTLRGNTHPLARPEYDQGAAPDSLPMERMLLVLQRSAEQEAALRKLLDDQQTKSSPNYHMWLTPEQFGQQFGPADADIQAVTSWLSAQGFQVSHVAAGRTVIEFSGTAGQVRQAFRTEMHKFVVKGEEHWANASDPQIPAALTPVVAGFASLNNFPRTPRHRRLGTFSRSKATGEVRPLFTFPYNGGYLLAVGPGDFANIYNVAPLWTAGIDGTGQTIAIVSDSNINTQDVVDFRTMFGLPANTTNIILNGPDPGINSDETEADLDVQWAGAVAKGATIDLVVSEGTETTAGVDLSALYIIDNNLAPVMTESYGTCEAFTLASGLAFYNTLWEQGAAQGITILIASGDSGSAGCDDPSSEVAAQYGQAVGGNASTPFNVAVGGTDFNDSNWQQYWNTTNTSPQQSSAVSYIPETTWNDSCATAGVLGCASGVLSDGTDLVAGSGGPSNCAYPTIVSGGIQCNSNAGIYGIPKPAWQSGTNVPSDSVRDTPDVSLFAGDGLNSSFYVFCEMDANASGGGSASSCDLNAPYLDFQGAGGTSASAQAFGGIMALVNQKTGQRQGNANYVLYPLAAQTGASCPATASAVTNPSCIFYDVQAVNNSVACYAGSPNCGNTNGAAGTYGILVYTSGTTTTPAWVNTQGYDLATGLGTVNAANLVNNWTSVSFHSTSTTLTLTPPTGYTLTNIPHGQPVGLAINVAPASATGDVSLKGGPNSSNLGIGFATLSSGAISTTTVLLPGGTYGVTAHYAGNGTYGASDSTPPVQVTVTPESSQTFVALLTFDPSTGQETSSNATSAVYGSPYLLSVGVTNSSSNACYSGSTGIPTYQCPAGQVIVTDNGKPPVDQGLPSGTPGTLTLNSQGIAEDQFIQFPAGTHAVVATYEGNTSYNGSTSATDTITISQAATSIGVTASATTVASGAPVTLTAVVNTTSFGFAPTGAVQFLNSNVPIGTGTPTGVNGSFSSYAMLTATLTTSFTSNATITAQYQADLNYSASVSSPLTVTISSGTPNFSLVATPNPFAISQGLSGTSTIGLSAINGFTGTVSFTCTVPSTMTGASCSLQPVSTTPGNTTTLTVNTVAPSTVIGPFNSPRWLVPIGGAIFAAFFLLLIPTRRRRLKLAFGSLFLVLLAAALVACGGSSSVSTTTTSGGTPTGNYTVTVTGTATIAGASVSNPLLVTVNVQ